MSDEAKQDARVITRRRRILWRGVLLGVLLAATGMFLAFVGFRIIEADTANVRPYGDLEMTLFALGALVLVPLGFGSILAALIASILVRGFGMRFLLFVILGCGVLLAVGLPIARDWLPAWLERDWSITVPSWVPRAKAFHFANGAAYAVPGPTAIAFSLVVGTLPLFALPLLLRSRRAIPPEPAADP